MRSVSPLRSWSLLLLLLAACSTSSEPLGAPLENLRKGGSALERSAYDVTIPSFDGTPIAATVFQPALVRAQTAPLVLHGHGFGGSRSKDLAADAGGDTTVRAALRAWERGMFVITFDQRGFGESGGTVKVMDPEFEGRDVQAILDWAEANLRPHLRYHRGDPLVGGLGFSYGGGFQLIGAALDARFDAIVPSGTWFDLRYSLNPGGVPKSLWIDLLFTGGLAGSRGRLDPFIPEAFLRALALKRVPEPVLERVYGNSLASFCDGFEGRQVPRVAAFLVQGVSDTLFNLNEAARQAACLRRAGNDVRLLVQGGGHQLPALQDASVSGIKPTVTCGRRRFDTAELMVSFLQEKLLGQRGLAVPKLCVTQSETSGLVLSELPVGGVNRAVPATTLSNGPLLEAVLTLLRRLSPSRLEALLRPLSPEAALRVTRAVAGLGAPETVLGDLPEVLALLSAEHLAELTSAYRFVPLQRIAAAQLLVGIPTAVLRLGGAPNPEPPILLVGLGRRRADGAVELINDQLAPLRGLGEHTLELVGVSAQLERGDDLGLLIYTFHPQYATSYTLLPTPITISGQVALPLHAAK
jgi:ABC-2 type transport system ATP-binding protein